MTLFARGRFAPQLVEEVFEEYHFVLLLGRFGLQRDPVRGFLRIDTIRGGI